MTLRKGGELDPATLERALADLGDGGIPWVVRVVREIPLTTWVPAPRPARCARRACRRRRSARPPGTGTVARGGYRKLSKAAIDRLLAGKG